MLVGVNGRAPVGSRYILRRYFGSPRTVDMEGKLGFWMREGNDRCRLLVLLPVSYLPDFVKIRAKMTTQIGITKEAGSLVFQTSVSLDVDFSGGDLHLRHYGRCA